MDSQQIINRTRFINGWLCDPELEILIKYASQVDGGNILEIGTAMGRSAAVLALASPNSTVVSLDNYVDWFNLRKEVDVSLTTFQQRNHTEAMQGLMKYDLSYHDNIHERIVLVVEDSQTYEWPADRELDLLFIDGNHAYSCVKTDYNRYVPFVKPGGVIIFDDFGFKIGERPRIAVREFIEDEGLPVKLEGKFGILEVNG